MCRGNEEGNVKLTVLGKYGPYGKAGVGAASGYLIEDGDFRLLCDMGSGVMSRLISIADVRTLSGVFISHLHYDHTSDLLSFRYLLDELKYPIKIFTHKEENNPYYDILFDSQYFEMIYIDEDTQLTVDGVKMEFFKMSHDVPDYAVKLTGSGTIMYTGDTTFNDEIIKGGRGCDYILADCSKPDVFIGAHMRSEYAFEIRKKTGAEIIATHLAPDFCHDKLFCGAEGITIAEEGRTYRTEDAKCLKNANNA